MLFCSARKSGVAWLVGVVFTGASFLSFVPAATAQQSWVPYHAMLRTNQGDDIGRNNGYTTVGLLTGIPLGKDVSGGLPYIDLRGHIENNGRIGYNLGGGYRWVDWSGDQRIWGVRASYDSRDYACKNGMICDHTRFDWLSGGLETLGRDWDLRANGYVNVGKRQKLGPLESVGFEGNNLLVAPLYAEALWGFDGEAGVSMNIFRADAKDTYLAFGGFHFDSRHGKDATGARIRFEVSPTDYLSFGVRGSIDTKFDTSVMARATLHFGSPPKAPGRSDANSKNTLNRLIEFPERQELVVVDEGLSKKKRILTDNLGQAVPFVHVDNTAPGGGNGTYESRYDQLTDLNGAGSNPGDIVILYRGDGTTHFYDQGVQLKNNQFLLGQGSFGLFNFAGTPVWFKLPGGRPTVTNVNPGGDAITLASNNTLIGFDVIGSRGNGIRGDGITSAHITDVNLRDNANDGIFITNANGQVTIENLSCSGNGFGPPAHGPTDVDCIDVKSAATGNLDLIYRNIRAFDNFGNGLEASSLTSGTMTLLEEGNTVYGNTEGGITIENFAASGGTNLIAVLRNNYVHDNAWQGILVGSGAGTGSLNLTIVGNVVDRNGYSPEMVNSPPMFVGPSNDQTVGISVNVNSSAATVLIDSNTVTNNAGTGIYIGSDVFDANASVSGRVTNNIVIGNGVVTAALANGYTGGIVGEASGFAPFTARLDLLVQNNTMSGNAPYGFIGYTLGDGTATVCTRVTGNSGTNTGHLLSQNGGFAVFPLAVVPGAGAFNLEPSTGTFTNLGAVNNVPLGTCAY